VLGTLAIKLVGTLSGTFDHAITTTVGFVDTTTTTELGKFDTSVHGTTTGLENVDGITTVPGYETTEAGNDDGTDTDTVDHELAATGTVFDDGK